ncbi:BspA family leucine-rich repeat surface protein [Haloflavibacter putidus]|uniref:BspA family leucine-rich repeat surface protein n=1 Tax=Haloflavibacter putidus TaxID=2576776 RepID=A0A507ZRU0_9FLAO|nr:BspA family leucine-rich repeat surface protein [Haloflavibacter putidus]TQD40516.1 BspA family leucine-rich repeat surface protein [Haloflavibacter putidus]
MQKLYLLLVFSFFFSFSNAQDAPFITTWEVEANDLEITIPTTGSGYDYTIDFGDGTVENNVSGNISHTYDSPGTYTVSITGDFPRIYFLASPYRHRIQSVEQWGDIEWASMQGAFLFCKNLILNANDTPDLSQVTDMSKMFYNAESLNQSLNNWDVSNVTNMNGMFYGTTTFNQSLNNWDVSNVTNMGGMFSYTDAFNQPLNEWDVSSVNDMSKMFYKAESFDQPLNNWNVSSVTDMKEMFFHATSFNQSLSDWDVSNVINMNSLFSGAVKFNKPLNNWDVSNVSDMGRMFSYTRKFNQSINNWNILSVTDMNSMFKNASSFNQPLNSWDVSNVSFMAKMFSNAILFNQPLSNWDVSNITNLESMFLDAWNFNQDLSNWNFNGNVDLSNFLNNSGLDIANYDLLLSRFQDLNLQNVNLSAWNLIYCDATTHNYLTEDLGWSIDGDALLVNCNTSIPEDAFVTRWEVSNADLSITIPANFSQNYNYSIDFGDGTLFNNQTGSITHTYGAPGIYVISITGQFPHIILGAEQGYKLRSIEQWGNIEWESMRKTFESCIRMVINATDTPDLSQVTNLSFMFHNARIFNRSINNWDVSNITNMNAMFSGATRFNKPLNEWNVSNVTNMKGMFEEAEFFDQPLNNWDVSSVTDMSLMFYGGTFNPKSSFNQPIGNWNVSNVTNMAQMFHNSPYFNQPLNNWDVSNVTNMERMFQFYDSDNTSGTNSFNQPLNNWNTSNVTDMDWMFLNNKLFNQPLNNWLVDNVTNMRGMFSNTTNFNQNLSNWSFNNEVTLNSIDDYGFIENSGLDPFNYDALLARFEELGIENKTLIADNLEYCNAGVRNELIDNLGWTISGDSVSEDCAFNYVSGNLHYDDNNDGCDNNDIPAEGFLINANDGTYDFGTFSLADGTYNLNLLEGNYTITLNNLPQYYTVNPETTTFNFTGAGEQEQLDFCLTANQTVEDLNITLLPTSEARPGFEADYQLVVENIGTQSLATANISLIFDDTKQSFVSATPAETSSTNNQLNFEVNNLPPFGQQVIDFTMQTFQPPTVNGDDILNFTATISPNANDYTPEDNTFIYEQTVVNSFDPNDKQVLQGEQVHIDKADQYLDYLIRFQNTGTASAINVRILDTLHPDLDYSTIKLISASADYRVEITNGNEVEFIFDDIYLPHADENEPESHGFVAYKIKPKAGVAIGDVITGDASIFFDFNAPIITNTVSTEFVDDLNTDSYSLENLVRIYPNPVTDLLNIETAENIQLKSLKLYNLQGQELLQFPQSTKRINLSQLSAGMYILKVQTNQGSINQQILKQ